MRKVRDEDVAALRRKTKKLVKEETARLNHKLTVERKKETGQQKTQRNKKGREQTRMLKESTAIQ